MNLRRTINIFHRIFLKPYLHCLKRTNLAISSKSELGKIYKNSWTWSQINILIWFLNFFAFFQMWKILKISKINSNISENIENNVFGLCEQCGMDFAPCITPIGPKWNLGFSKSTIMVEMFEIFEIFRTLVDYTRELRDQMSWKSPDSWFSDNVDVV